MHRTTTRRDLLLISAVLALFVLASCTALATDKPPTLKSTTPPTKTVTVAYTKPTLPVQTPTYIDDLPLSHELQEVTREACKEYGVPVELALAVMETESQLTVDAVGRDGHDIGLFQLRDTYHWWLTEQTGWWRRRYSSV